MKKLKFLFCLSFLITFYNCSSDDDSSNTPSQTIEQLLTSGKWYFESKNTGSYTDCEKRGYIQFAVNGNVTVDSFDDSSGSCSSLGAVVATYTLTNNMNLTIEFGEITQNVVINSITENELRTTNSGTGETNVFDKNEG